MRDGELDVFAVIREFLRRANSVDAVTLTSRYPSVCGVYMHVGCVRVRARAMRIMMMRERERERDKLRLSLCFCLSLPSLSPSSIPSLSLT